MASARLAPNGVGAALAGDTNLKPVAHIFAGQLSYLRGTVVQLVE